MPNRSWLSTSSLQPFGRCATNAIGFTIGGPLPMLWGEGGQISTTFGDADRRGSHSGIFFRASRVLKPIASGLRATNLQGADIKRVFAIDLASRGARGLTRSIYFSPRRARPSTAYRSWFLLAIWRVRVIRTPGDQQPEPVFAA